MDLSTNSIGWHRTRKWLDDEIENSFNAEPYNDEHKAYLTGLWTAYMKVRPRFNTPEENALAEQTRREMFG